MVKMLESMATMWSTHWEHIFLILEGNSVSCWDNYKPIWHYWCFLWAERNVQQLVGIKGHQLWHQLIIGTQSWITEVDASYWGKAQGDICCVWISKEQAGCVFVALCPSFSRITQKVLNHFPWIVVERWAKAHLAEWVDLGSLISFLGVLRHRA